MKKIYLIPIAVSIILFMFTVSCIAIAPFHPNVVEEYRAKGELHKLIKQHNELKQEIHNRMGTDTIKSVRSKGNNNVIVVIMNYSNLLVNSVSTPTFYENLFENGLNGDGMSWRKYYLDMSDGQLDIGFDLFGPYTSSLTRESCGGNNYDNVRTLVSEAIYFANEDGANFANYDNDGDGYADCVIVIHAGRGRETSGNNNDIHSHMSAISPVNYDGVKIRYYSIQGEYLFTPGDSAIGVFVHEFGHLLGLPDLYDTTYNTDGVGRWSTMASGSYAGPEGSPASRPVPLLAWEKAYLDWPITIYDITNMSSKNTELSSNDNTLKYNNGDIVFMLSFGLLSIIGLIVAVLSCFKKGMKNTMTIFLFIFLFVLPVVIFTYGCLPPGFKLTTIVSPANSGIIEKNPNKTYFADNSEVSVKAISTPHYIFSNWEGDITGTNNPQTLIMDSNKTITAKFTERNENEYAITDVESSRSAIRINLNSEQYYLLENKVIKAGTWTEYLPGNGLLISHIDSRYTPPENYSVNDDINIHGINIKEADGNNELWTNGGYRGEVGDTYQTPKSLTPYTSPNSNLNGTSQNNGGSSGISITNISSAGDIMIFTYTKD